MYYDIPKTALIIYIMCASIKVLSLIFITLAWKTYKPPPDSTEMDKTETTTTNADGQINQRNVDPEDMCKAVSNGDVTLFSDERKDVDSALSVIEFDHTYF